MSLPINNGLNKNYTGMPLSSNNTKANQFIRLSRNGEAYKNITGAYQLAKTNSFKRYYWVTLKSCTRLLVKWIFRLRLPDIALPAVPSPKELMAELNKALSLDSS